jgi:predicted nucleic acid-binding protein
MFVLDTNILSATMGANPDPQVGAWIAARPLTLLFTTAICQAEILAGLATMPDGQRRRAFDAAARAMFQEDFAGRVLPFDTDATAIYAELFAARRRAGRPAAVPDLMIAAVARAQGANMVTRDFGGFEGCGLTLINPWQAP